MPHGAVLGEHREANAVLFFDHKPAPGMHRAARSPSATRCLEDARSAPRDLTEPACHLTSRKPWTHQASCHARRDKTVFMPIV